MLHFLRDTQHKINEVVILAVERNLNIVISLRKDNLETIVDDQIQQINPLRCMVWQCSPIYGLSISLTFQGVIKVVLRSVADFGLTKTGTPILMN